MASCVKWSGLIGGAVRDKIGRVVVAPALARGGGVGGARRRSVMATMMELVGARRDATGGRGEGVHSAGELSSCPICASRKACERKWAAVFEERFLSL
jgi:hypothetical protein